VLKLIHLPVFVHLFPPCRTVYLSVSWRVSVCVSVLLCYCRERDLFKVVFGLTYAAKRKKNSKARAPPKDACKRLTKRLKAKLKTEESGMVLLKQDFVDEFYVQIYEVNDDLVEEYKKILQFLQ